MKAKVNFYKWFILLLVMCTGSLQVQAQTLEEKVYAAGETGVANIVIMVLLVFIILILLLVLYFAFSFIRTMQQEKGVKSAPIIDFTQAVPIEREAEILLDHDYDGIKELDNKLPPWWLYMFYATVIFSVIYLWYYHIYQSGNTQEQEYAAEMVEAEKQLALAANKVNENNVSMLKDQARIAKGMEVYQKNCANCHGDKGQGDIGPNLTDDYWLHGADVKSIFKTIKYGVDGKGMKPWQAELSPAQIQETASYVKSLKGTNPPNGKEPQGVLVKE